MTGAKTAFEKSMICAKVGHDVLVEYDPPMGTKKRVRKRCTRCGAGLNWRPFSQESFKAILEEPL